MKDYYVLECLTIVAILLAPLVALRISVKLDERKEIKRKKLDIFRGLMATRGTPLSLSHIEALNRISVEYYDNDKVIEAWKIYLDHLSYVNYGGQKPKDESEWKLWTEKKQELLADILEQMALVLGYTFFFSKPMAWLLQTHLNLPS